MNITMLGFDADDTLWHTELHYLQVQDAVVQLLSSWQQAETIQELINQVNIDNLPQYGYGIKPFILSLIEAAIRISGGEVRADQLEQILSMGKRMISAELVLRPQVEETLQTLSAAYPMMLITKGDLLDQTTKLKRSGLGDYFSIVEVVTEKSAQVYECIFNKHHINPANFLMVGNTIRSDILPILDLGGSAVYIPADSTWEHETVPNFNRAQNGFYELEHMGQLPVLIAQLSAQD